MLSITSWHVIEMLDDIDDIQWAWEHFYQRILKDHLTKTCVKVRTNSKPWMNSNIRKEVLQDPKEQMYQPC